REPVAGSTTADGARRRVSPVLVAVGLVVLVAVVGGVVLLLNRGEDSAISDRTFAREVNENVLGPLGRADRIGGDVASLSSDGNRIVRAADSASGYLRGLSGLSTRQEAQVKLVLAFVAANRVYGQALARYTPGDDEAQLALDRAAAA